MLRRRVRSSGARTRSGDVLALPRPCRSFTCPAPVARWQAAADDFGDFGDFEGAGEDGDDDFGDFAAASS